jgi:hypothetical protein
MWAVPRAVSHPLRAGAIVAAVSLLGATAVGCGALSPEPDDARPGPPGWPATIAVPADASTIQQAVDAAVPGDLVLIAAGTYRESVTVATPRIVLRGTDRRRVVVDGESRRDAGITVTAPEVAVENLTLRRHRSDGLVFTGTAVAPLAGYRASYLTVQDNARHGIRARHARRGLIEHSFTAGHPASGIHIAHCLPCQSVVRDTVSADHGRDVRLTGADDVRVTGTATGGAGAAGRFAAAAQPQRPGGATGTPEPAVTRPG